MTTTKLTTRPITSVDHEPDLAKLVAKARAGCEMSWHEIVDRFRDHLQHVALAHGLDRSAAADAVQQTWLAAVANIDSLRNAQALGGWLRSILHRECLKTLRLYRRETPHLDDIVLSECTENTRIVMMYTEPRSPEEETLRVERRMLMHIARRRLSPRDQDLLALLIAEPPLSYTEIAHRLGMSLGSIGPTRARCFARMRREFAALSG